MDFEKQYETFISKIRDDKESPVYVLHVCVQL